MTWSCDPMEACRMGANWGAGGRAARSRRSLNCAAITIAWRGWRGTAAHHQHLQLCDFAGGNARLARERHWRAVVALPVAA